MTDVGFVFAVVGGRVSDMPVEFTSCVLIYSFKHILVYVLLAEKKFDFIMEINSGG